MSQTIPHIEVSSLDIDMQRFWRVGGDFSYIMGSPKASIVFWMPKGHTYETETYLNQSERRELDNLLTTIAQRAWDEFRASVRDE